MKRRYVMFIRLGQFRIFAEKLFIALTLISAICLVILSKVNPMRLNQTESGFLSLLMPVIHVMQIPADGVFYLMEKTKDIIFVYDENEKLKQKNAELDRLRIKLRFAETENALLSEMLNYSAPKNIEFITAKVISGIGDGFAHSIIVYVPDAIGIHVGQIAIHKQQVIGRVDLINGSYVRILLVSDISSKIPVIIARSRERAILSGNNTSVLNLLYTVPSADIRVGDQVVTSGVGGIFPSDLLVGYVTKVKDRVIEVQPAFPIEKIEYIQILNYQTKVHEYTEDIQ